MYAALLKQLNPYSALGCSSAGEVIAVGPAGLKYLPSAKGGMRGTTIAQSRENRCHGGQPSRKAFRGRRLAEGGL